MRVITSNALVKQQHEAKTQDPIVELIEKTTYKCQLYPNGNANVVGICLHVPDVENQHDLLVGLNAMCKTASICNKLHFLGDSVFTKSKVIAQCLVKNGFIYIPEKSAIVTVNT